MNQAYKISAFTSMYSDRKNEQIVKFNVTYTVQSYVSGKFKILKDNNKIKHSREQSDQGWQWEGGSWSLASLRSES